MKQILIPLLLLTGNLFAVDSDPGASLRAACAKHAADALPVAGSDGWYFLPAELRHVSVGKFWGPEAASVSKASNPKNADPLPAILDFKKQLDAVGIDLILVPVPAKVFVYPEALSGGDAKGPAPVRKDTFHQQFFDELKKDGVTVVDLLPDLLAQRNGANGPMFCKQDTHWSGMATVLAADKIAALLKDKPWLAAAPKIKASTSVHDTEITGDLWGMITANPPVKETIKLRMVGADGSNGMTAIPVDKESPILLLGDSHTLVFHDGGDMLATGAGLADQLASSLGVAVDLIGVRGSGATPSRINLMRKAHSDLTYLGKKKVVIWCFTERELTEGSGWALVPVVAK